MMRMKVLILVALLVAPIALLPAEAQTNVWRWVNGRLFGPGITLSGHQLFSPDNTYDIGASGATRPRSLYVGTDITAGANITGSTVTATSHANVGANGLRINNVMALSGTAPTVTSAGTNPSVAGANTAAFRVNVGTGGTATTIVMAMPTAATNWNCDAQNLTANAANRANQHVVQQSSTTTAVTVQNQTISTGVALAFTASDIVRFLCMAY